MQLGLHVAIRIQPASIVMGMCICVDVHISTYYIYMLGSYILYITLYAQIHVHVSHMNIHAQIHNVTGYFFPLARHLSPLHDPPGGLAGHGGHSHR